MISNSTSVPCAREIAHALHGRKSGPSYVCCCPAHDDKKPSLSLRDTAEGKTLVHCHAGCEQRDVIESLRQLGLWPEKTRLTNRVPLSEADRRCYTQARRTAPQLAHDAELWWRERREELERTKADALDCGDIGTLAWAARTHYVLGELAGEGIVRAYLQACYNEPQHTAALIDSAECWERWSEAAITLLVARWTREAA